MAQNNAKIHGATTPQSNFATRKLAFVVVDMNTDVETDFDTIGSVYQKAVQGIQQIAEIYALGQPNGERFTVILSDDTLPYDDGQEFADGGENSPLSRAIREATGVQGAWAWNAELNGDDLNYD
jgi:hypothetical protein